VNLILIYDVIDFKIDNDRLSTPNICSPDRAETQLVVTTSYAERKFATSHVGRRDRIRTNSPHTTIIERTKILRYIVYINGAEISDIKCEYEYSYITAATNN